MNRDLTAVVAAFLLHCALGYGLILAPRGERRQIKTVQVDVRRPIPPSLPKIKPPPEEKLPPPPPEKVKVKHKRIEKAPIPNETRPVQPPKAPVKPVFGVTMSSTAEGDSSFSVPVGNTTIADPNGPRSKEKAVAPLPSVPQGFVPAADNDIATYPEYEEGSCDIAYPDGQAKNDGIQGKTILKVEVDEKGKVHGVRVVKAIGHGLDALAVELLKKRCRFGPARNKAGKALPSVLTHTVNWVLE